MAIQRENISVTAPPPAATRFDGFYRGRVVEHGVNGMCRVWIPEAYPPEWEGEENHKFLPFAEQAQPITAFGSQPRPENADKSVSIPPPGGVYTYPAIGSYVWCFFVGGKIQNPVYFAACTNGSMVSRSEWENVEISDTTKGLEFRYQLPAESAKGGQPDELRVKVFTKDNRRAVKISLVASSKKASKIVNNEVKLDSTGMQLFSTGTVSITGLQGVNLNGMNIALTADGKVNVHAKKTSITLTSPLIVADCQSDLDRSGHFLLKFWDRFMGEVKPVTMKYPL